MMLWPDCSCLYMDACVKPNAWSTKRCDLLPRAVAAHRPPGTPYILEYSVDTQHVCLGHPPCSVGSLRTTPLTGWQGLCRWPLFRSTLCCACLEPASWSCQPSATPHTSFCSSCSSGAAQWLRCCVSAASATVGVRVLLIAMEPTSAPAT